MGAVTEEDVGWGLSRQLGLTFVDIDPDSLDYPLVRTFDEALLRRSDAVVLLQTETEVSLAVADPTDEDLLDRLESAAGVPLRLVIGTPTAIRRALDHVFGPRRAGSGAADAVALGAHAASGAAEDAEDKHAYDVMWERSGETFLAFHVSNALRSGARELHFLPGDGQLRIHYREAGRLVEIASEPERVQESLLARIGALGGPSLSDGTHARGRLRCPVPHADVLLDASLLRSADGVCVTLVVSDETATPATLEALGVEAGDAAELREAIAMGAGLIVVGGPRGAGGSALLAALATAAGTAGVRTVVIEAGPPLAIPHSTRVALPARVARGKWSEIALAQCADVLVLDDVLVGDAIVDVLDGAVAGRLVLVRTDWCDSGAMIDRLLAAPGARGTLAPRLLAVLQTRRVEPVGAVAAGPPLLIETLIVGEAMRQGLEQDADAAHVLGLAAAAGFRTLAQRGAERIAAGLLTAAELHRART